LVAFPSVALALLAAPASAQRFGAESFTLGNGMQVVGRAEPSRAGGGADGLPLTLDTSARTASMLVEIQLENLGIDYLDRRAALFGAVTLDQAKRIARNLLDPDGLSLAVVGDSADLTPTRIVHPGH
jgi:predicted amino acid dehydrogenase